MASITSYTKAKIDALMAGFAPLVSPAFTGNPTVPNQALGDNTTRAANTAFVAAAVAALVNASPGTLDTLKELADALGDDANFAATMTTALGLKAPLISPTFTGDPKAPTPAAGDNDTSIATTAFVTTSTTQTAGDSTTKPATTAFVQGEKNKVINPQAGTAYTLVLADANKVIESSNAAVQTITIPPNTAVAFPIGTMIQLTWIGATKPSFAAGAGVTLNAPGGLLGCRVLWSTITLRKRGTDLWVLSDDVG